MITTITITRFGQAMLQGDIYTVFQVLDMFDKSTIDSISINACQKESSDNYEATAICNMTRAWKTIHNNNPEYQKLLI